MQHSQIVLPHIQTNNGIKTDSFRKPEEIVLFNNRFEIPGNQQTALVYLQ